MGLDVLMYNFACLVAWCWWLLANNTRSDQELNLWVAIPMLFKMILFGHEFNMCMNLETNRFKLQLSTSKTTTLVSIWFFLVKLHDFKFRSQTRDTSLSAKVRSAVCELFCQQLEARCKKCQDVSWILRGMKFELEFADLKRYVVRESLIERCGHIEMHMNVKYQNSYLQSWYLELTTNEYKSQTITNSFYIFEQININLMNYLFSHHGQTIAIYKKETSNNFTFGGLRQNHSWCPWALSSMHLPSRHESEKGWS